MAKLLAAGFEALPQRIASGKFNFEWAQISTKRTGATGSGLVGLVGLVSGPINITVVQFSMFCSTAKEETEGGLGC